MVEDKSLNNLVIKKARNGKGIFANKNFKKGYEILKLKKGKLMSYEEIVYDKNEDKYVQVDKKLYFNPFGNLIVFLNHSCNPNVGIIIKQNEIHLVAIKNIFIGEEITFDYSTTMDEDDWTMKCNCGDKNCREIIKDFKHLPKFIQKKYLELGIVPDYIKKDLQKYLKSPPKAFINDFFLYLVL
ncbi:MAG: SET domain-containing protein [Candidatus Pacearchaeota archaeon]